MDSGQASDSDPSSSISPDTDHNNTARTVSSNVFGGIVNSSSIPTREYTPIHVTTTFSPSSTTSDLASSISTNSTTFPSCSSSGQVEIDTKNGLEHCESREMIGKLLEDPNGAKALEKIFAKSGLEKGVSWKFFMHFFCNSFFSSQMYYVDANVYIYVYFRYSFVLLFQHITANNERVAFSILLTLVLIKYY